MTKKSIADMFYEAFQKDPTLGFSGALKTYVDRLNAMQAGPAQQMLDTAADPNAEGIQRAANLMGGLGLKVANPLLAIMPSSQELRDRGYKAGASPLVQAVGGTLGDVVNIPDPATSAAALTTLGKAAFTAKGIAAAAPIIGKSAAVLPLGKGLAELMAETSPAEQLALKARLEAEAGQVGGAASNVSREQALQELTGAKKPKGVVTQSYKATYDDGSTRWVPGTLRVNAPTNRFNSELTPAELKRLGDLEPTKQGEFRTQSYKEVYPDGTVKFVPGTLRVKKLPASREQDLQGLTGKAESTADDGIDAWHGSPHNFDSFDNAHIGSGEGTQYQGRGFYFGDKKWTGDWYRNRLSAPLDYPIIKNDILDKIDEVAPEGLAHVLKRADAVFENIGIGGTHPSWSDFKDYAMSGLREGGWVHSEAVKALDILGKDGGWADEFNKRRGHLYNVSLQVKPENMADISLPVKKTPKLSRAVDADPNLRGVVTQDHSGDTFINALENVYGPEGAASWMQNAGFDGIKYPNHEAVKNGVSREGAYNYVVYDPKKIRIKSKK
jgi:hypothetical protein